MLHHLKHLTLKYFEIFYADTIPLLMLDRDHAAGGVRARRAGADAARQGAPKNCSTRCGGRTTTGALVQDVRRHLAAHYSYDRRVEELVAAMRN